MQLVSSMLRRVSAPALVLGSVSFLASCQSTTPTRNQLLGSETMLAAVAEAPPQALPGVAAAFAIPVTPDRDLAEDPQGTSSSTRAQGKNTASNQGAQRPTPGGNRSSDAPNKTRVGAALAFNNGDTGDYLEVELEAAHRIVGNFEFGGVFGYYDESNDAATDDSAWYLGPTVRFYFVDKGQWQPWITATAAIGEVETNVVIYDPFTKSEEQIGLDADLTLFQVGLGISHFVSDWVAVEAALVRNMYEYEFTDPFYGGSYSTDLDDTRFTIGISTFF